MTRTTIGIAAPSSPFERQALEQGTAWMRAAGYGVVLHDGPDGPGGINAREGFLAGSDERRAGELLALDADPGVDVIWCARGGYGAMRLLPRLDRNPAFIASAKTLVGFSDVTALHMLRLARGAGAGAALHAPLVTTVARAAGPEADHLKKLLTSLGAAWSIAARGPVLHRGGSGGRVAGPLIGGCLSVLTRLIGTPYLPSLRGAILALEDTDERPYRIDRMLTHLLLAGLLDGVAGIAVGDFIRCEPPPERAGKPGERGALDVIMERTAGLGVPVVAGLPFGHGEENWALPLGRRAVLDADGPALASA